MTYPIVQFVRRPEVGAAVRFDFNTAGEWATEDTWFGHEGFSIGTPSLAGDPDGIGVEYGLRSLAFNLFIEGSKADAGRVMTALSRELLRQSNWLLFQLSPDSAPVWFKTYRSQPGDLSLDHVYVEGTGRWGIAVNLVADPWAYGERVTLPSASMLTDPLSNPATTLPSVHQLPPIKGDAPTPLHIRTGAPRNERQVLSSLAMEPGTLADSYNRPLFVRNWAILYADTTAVTGLPATTAIGGNVHQVTFATNAAMKPRLRTDSTTGTLAKLVDGNGVDFDNLTPGRWRAFLRVRVPSISGGSTASTFQLRLGIAPAVITPAEGGIEANTDWRFGPTVTHSQFVFGGTGTITAPWLDMGEVSFPQGAPLVDGYADTLAGNVKHLAVEAARTAGNLSLYIDELMLVPVELTKPGTLGSTMAFVDKGTTPYDYGDYMHLDAEADRVVVTVKTAGVESYVSAFAAPPVVRGSLPWVHPGATNLLHYLPKTFDSEVQGTPQPWDVSYQPRYLYLAGT